MSYKEARDKAAQAYSQEIVRIGFKAGADWAIESSEILTVLKELQLLITNTESLMISEYSGTSMLDPQIKLLEPARLAVKNFEAVVK